MLKKVYFVCLLSVFSTEAAVSQYQDTKGNVNLNVTTAKPYLFNKISMVSDHIHKGRHKSKNKFIVDESGRYQVGYRLSWTTDDPSPVQLQTFLAVNDVKAASSVAYSQAKKDVNDGYSTNAGFVYLNLREGDKVAMKYRVIGDSSSKVASIPNTSNISFEYKGPITDTTTGGKGLTCKDIKDKNPSAASGIYKLDPDGAKGEIQPFDAYCDMESQGGGWTLVGVKKPDVKPNIIQSLTDPNIEQGVISDKIWQKLKSDASEVYAKMDVGAWGILSVDAMSKATCVPLADSLVDSTLAHSESSGCDGSGQDYSLFGYTTERENSIIYDYSNNPFIKEHGGSGWDENWSSGLVIVAGVANKMMIYIR